METKKIFTILLATIFIWATNITFADRDYDDDRYEKNDDKYERDYDEKYINPSNLSEKVKNYISKNYNSEIIKAKIDHNEIEVKLKNGTEVKFYSNGTFKYAEIDDDYKYKKYDNKYRPVEPNNGIGDGAESLDVILKKEENKKLRASYKAKFKAKLGNRLDSISKIKLETIVKVIDNKILELKESTTKTEAEKERLIIIYDAIRDLITDKIAELNSDNILEDLLK